MLNSTSRVVIKLDPRTKIFLLVIFNILIFAELNPWARLGLTLLPMLLMALEGRRQQALFSAVLCLLAGLGVIYLGERLGQGLGLVVGAVLFFFAGLMPLLLMGLYVMTTTSPGELILALTKLGLPRFLVIPLAVLFRLIPTIGQEARFINMAMKMRGIRLGGRHPSRILEYRLIPLLMSIVKIGDELSAAAVTRCIDAPGPKTSIYEIGFKPLDWLVLGAGLVITVLVIFI